MGFFPTRIFYFLSKCVDKNDGLIVIFSSNHTFNIPNNDWKNMNFVIVVFPDHTHLLFLLNEIFN